MAVVERKMAAARAIGYPLLRLIALGDEWNRVCFAMALLQLPGPNGDVFDMHKGVLYSIMWIAPTNSVRIASILRPLPRPLPTPWGGERINPRCVLTRQAGSEH